MAVEDVEPITRFGSQIRRSRPLPVATRSPSGLNTARRRDRHDHAELPRARRWPRPRRARSRLRSTSLVGGRRGRRRRSRPGRYALGAECVLCSRSQSPTVWSADAVAAVAPSGLSAAPRATSSWQQRRSATRLVRGSHTFAPPSPSTPRDHALPSLEYANCLLVLRFDLRHMRFSGSPGRANGSFPRSQPRHPAGCTPRHPC